MQSTGIDSETWEDLAGDRSNWQKTCLTGVKHCIASDIEKRRRWKDPTASPSPAARAVVEYSNMKIVFES